MRAARGLLPLLATIPALALPALADDITGYVEASYTCATSENEFVGLPVGTADRTSFQQRVNFRWSRRVLPNLVAEAGAYYEHVDDTLKEEGFSQDSVRSKLRPFVRLSLRTPFTLGELSWDRNDERSRTDDLARLRLVRDTFIATAGWTPSELPAVRLELSRYDDRDDAREFVDRNESVARLTSWYQPVPSTRLYYRGQWTRQEDQVNGTRIRTVSHNGQVNFADTYFDGRWDVGGNWNTTYRTTKSESSGTGEILTPVPPVGGLFALDDTPDQGPLASLPALVDGNTVVGTVVNLGLVPPAGDDRPRNFGIDLGIERDVNVLRVWVDRELPFEIYSTFSWEIWTSTDAQFWSRTATLPAAPFGPFDNRFELRFPDVLSRYVKVVVRPLAPTVPDASSYPAILVTEVEPFSSRPTSESERETSDTRHLAQANSRVRILDLPELFYETTYSLITSSRGPTSWTLSNGLSTRHRFNEVWSMSGRVAREDGLDRDRDRTAYIYSGLVNATPYEKLRHSLIVSGFVDDTGGVRTSNHGVILNTTALVYQGVDLNFLAGSSHSETIEFSSDALQLGAGATLVPHRTVTVTLRYDDRDATISRGSVPDEKDRTRSGEASVAYSPRPSVYLFASRRKEQRTREGNRIVDAFAFSWSPFPGGALQVSIAYNETRYSDLNEVNKVFVPFLRWNIRPGSYFQIAYQAISRDSDLGRTRDDIVTATLRIGF